MNVKNKKGFTLIELLAVIVILAIIALIATPIILGIVEDARKDSFMRSVELVINATDIDIFNKNYNDTYTYTINDGNVSNLEIGVKNTDGMNGSITYDKNGNDIYAIHNGKYCVIKEEGMKKAEIKDYVEGECELTIPTDASYFTYADILKDFRIVDKDACVEFLREWYNEEYTNNVCNNVSVEWMPSDVVTMTLTEYANTYPTNSLILALIEEGVLNGSSTGNVVIARYSEEGPKDVIIPSKINGKNVTVIEYAAFEYLELKSVVIPNTIKIIGEGAFYGNTIQNLSIPSSVKKIDFQAFAENSLQEVIIPSNVEYIGSHAFAHNSLQQVIIENDDIEISGTAFCDNPFTDDDSSESYQTIYDINPNALECPTED